MIEPKDYEHVKTLMLDIDEYRFSGGPLFSEYVPTLSPNEIVLLILCAACGLIVSDQKWFITDPTTARIVLTDRGEEWLHLYKELKTL